jgi:quercetin dioxygenase-like cupin family protein
MGSDAIFIKKGDQKTQIARPGRLYKMKVKSDKMEAKIAEIEPHTQSRWYQHDGEEIHLCIEGEMEYQVGDHSYKLSKGDVLWHKSRLKHRAKNLGDTKVKYLTIGTPPTFIEKDF